MPQPALVLFDDRTARDWMPFALTRPVGELRFGTLTLRGRAERVLGTRCLGHITAEHLRPFDEPEAPGVLDRATLPRDRDVLFLSSRAVPEWSDTRPPFGHEPFLLRLCGEICGWYAPRGTEFPTLEFLDVPAEPDHGRTPVHEIAGSLVERPWHLITGNAARVTRDISALFPDHRSDAPGPGVHLIGDAPLVVGADVAIEPGVVLDLRGGPIWLDDGARVAAFTRLAGPAYVGRGSVLLGGSFDAVSIGPVCKVHGELEASIVLGYSNKAHDGFLGHAYLGQWVNLGASTINSDLKNNYGTIRIWTPTGEVDTGEQKLGCLLGDHVKTAIGTLLNTGTVVGAGANVFGAESPTRYVRPFSWGGGAAAGEYALERFLETARTVMARRNIELTEDRRRLLEAAWRVGREKG